MHRADLTSEYVRRIVDYDPHTGVLTWLPRTPDMFDDGGHSAEHNSRKWNARFAGSIASTKNAHGYVCVRINGNRYLAHRIAWLYMVGSWPPDQIDHKNGDTGDNRWDNLRLATHSENHQNLKVKKSNRSGYSGVHWHVARSKWAASIKFQRRNIHLGFFDSAEDAHAAYLQAKAKYHTFNPVPRGD